jgi:dTDP-4-dehydrorhamnose reductase
MTEPRTPTAARPPLELWAGPECTVNRVGDEFRDQLEDSGFAHRLDDIDRLASLGITRMRFPLLWERTAPSDPERFDWRYADERIERLHALRVKPIAGLVHHGSGPRYTHLLDAAFPRKLASYARAVAERYPHIDAYTPVNEPLTTARFAGLYGFWYPHHRNDASFVQALMNQILGTVLAMRAVREVKPRALLVQTEDLGLTRSTPKLKYQADFENLRRWLSFDLLCGRLDRNHRLWRYLVKHGASEAVLQSLVDEPCAPDVIGINSYVTSERFLDDRLAHYPPELHGGNRRHRYADVETVRVRGQTIGGFTERLREAHARYGRPLAITEVHLGCTRDEQMRWLNEAWLDAHKVREEGADVRAVTVWAAFGAHDWNSLVTRRGGHYEPGLWDVRCGDPPRETALAGLARMLARGEAADLPGLVGPPWWQRDERFLYPVQQHLPATDHAGQPMLITGATGTLGQAFGRQCRERGLPHQLLRRAQLDITEETSIEAAIARWQPWAIVNTAGYVRVDEAEDDPRQWRENAEGPALLARVCARHGVKLMTFSSDLVFDGAQREPYVERDTPHPLNAYGSAKRESEREVLRQAPDALVIRSSAFFGPWDEHNFVHHVVQTLSRGERLYAAEDQVVSPTYVPDLVNTALDLLIDGERGLWHLTNRGAVSWAEFARLAAQCAGLDASLVVAVPTAELGQVARRPAYAVLGTERGELMPPLGDAMGRYFKKRREMAVREGEVRELASVD